MFVCWDLNIYGHITTVPACSSVTLINHDQCAATQECHVADTGHDTPGVVLSIDVGRHT